MNTTLTIDVLSDVVCPWCLIGKRRLEQALAMYAERHPDRPAPLVRWHPFQLNPDMPETGMSRADYVRRKFGDRADTVYDRVKAVGRSLDIPFQIDAIARQPNTAAAHSLIGLAEVGEQQQRLVESLFCAYFLEGVDLTRPDELARLAIDAGLSADAVQTCLDSAEARDAVRASDERARQMGVQGVPFFIFNNQVGLSGAHEPETLLQAMAQSLEPQAGAEQA